MSAPGFRRERAGARPAANKQTMIVEGQGMGFWTRVRLPSSPLKRNKSNGIVCCESDLHEEIPVNDEDFFKMDGSFNHVL